VLSARKLKFWLQAFVPNTLNFEIPLKTQESKNFEISFENFQKLLDGSKFDKRLGIYSELFSDLEILKFSLRKSCIFLEKRSKIYQSPSGYKLES
jgi:hypothetical protein